MKNLVPYIVIAGLFIFSNCKRGDTNARERLTVTLDIIDDIDVEQIIMTSDGGADTILGSRIYDQGNIQLRTPLHGEGVFSIRVYTKTNTLRSRDIYVEGGNRIMLKLEKSEFTKLQNN